MSNTKSRLLPLDLDDYQILMIAVNSITIKGEDAEKVSDTLKKLKHNESVLLTRERDNNGS
tara:strand:- start:644 stop:826 length:183 start_codon:yes stop_codon:yes gene_type:complete